MVLFLRLNFAAGFFGVRTYATDYHQLIMVENGGVNNTLSPSEVCPNANNADIGGLGTTQLEKWAAIYLKPATQRIGSMITGVNLTATDLFEMQLTCAYEVCHTIRRTDRFRNLCAYHFIPKTVALGYSKFCDLFTVDEWEGFEYAHVRHLLLQPAQY